MTEFEAEKTRPEFNASFLFLLDLATTFQKCNQARSQNNPQMLLRHLESISLMLIGYYCNSAQEKSCKELLVKIRKDLNEVIRKYEETEKLEISEKLWLDLYDLEYQLRDAWQKSDLQMSMKSKDELDDY